MANETTNLRHVLDILDAIGATDINVERTSKSELTIDFDFLNTITEKDIDAYKGVLNDHELLELAIQNEIAIYGELRIAFSINPLLRFYIDSIEGELNDELVNVTIVIAKI